MRSADPVVLAGVAVVAGAVLRLVWLRSVHPPDQSLFSDMRLYVQEAQRIASGGGLRSTDVFQAPGTHLLLAGIFVIFGTGSGGLDAATGAWWLMSSVTPVLVGLFVADLAGRRAGAIAAAVCALWPLYISYSGYFLSEPPGIFFVALTMFLLVRAARGPRGARQYALWVAAGASAGATMAIRPQLAILFAAAAVFGLLGLRRNWRGVIAGVAALAVVLAGVVVHNSIATGHRTGLSGNSGDVFFHGQCHARDLVVVDPHDGGFIHTTSTVETQHTRGRDYAFRTESPNLERFLFHRGLDCIRDHGVGQLRYWGENVLDGLSATTPWPQVVASDWTRNAARIANNAYTWMLCLLVAAAVVAIVRRRRRGEPVRTLLFLLTATLLWVPLAIVFFGAPRYRQPFDLFAFGLFAALLAARPARVRD